MFLKHPQNKIIESNHKSDLIFEMFTFSISKKNYKILLPRNFFLSKK